jgi:hypothetical protein
MSGVPPLARITVGVIVERRKARNPWIEFAWQPVMALSGHPVAAAWTPLSQSNELVLFYAGSTEIALYRTESANYRDNLASGAPSLWIALRPTGLDPPYELVAVTADPAEGESFTQTGADLVAAVSMPSAVREVIADFVAAYPPAPPFRKRKRDRADPETLARGRPTLKDVANERS